MEFFIILLLVLLNGFFSLSEIALVSSRKTKLERMSSKNSGAKVALRLIDNSENYLSAIQTGITLIGILTGAFTGMNLADNFVPFISKIGFLSGYAYEIAFVIIVALITYISIVFGELVPKTVALRNPEAAACFVAPFISFMCKLFYPIVKILSISTMAITKLLRITAQPDRLTEEELRFQIRNASKEGLISEGQEEIYHNIMHLSEKKAMHLLTHRTALDALDINDSIDVIMQMLRSTKHSRLVCYDGSIDNFRGHIIVKDCIAEFYEKQEVNILSLIVKPVIVTENSRAITILEKFRNEHLHLCFVVNEYGGLEGIITLHDLMEGILGSLAQEGDSDYDVELIDDCRWIVKGSSPIEVMSDLIPGFTIDFRKVDYSSIGGFILHTMQKVPNVGDKLIYMDHELWITKMEGNHILEVQIKRIPPDDHITEA